jgi:hypothetical protein
MGVRLVLTQELQVNDPDSAHGPEGGGTGKSAGFGLENLRVVIQIE